MSSNSDVAFYWAASAHAMWLSMNNGEFAHNHQWDGDTYLEDTDQGERWAVSFSMQGVVAVFYSDESERNPFPPGSPPYDQTLYFRGMPDTLGMAKERALARMIRIKGCDSRQKI